MSRFRAVWLSLALVLTFAFATLPAAARGRPARLLFAGRGIQRPASGSGRRDVLTPQSKDQMSCTTASRRCSTRSRPADLPNYFKPNVFGLGEPDVRSAPSSRPATPACGSSATSFEVPHVYGANRDDVMFGIGWVTAEDRGS